MYGGNPGMYGQGGGYVQGGGYAPPQQPGWGQPGMMGPGMANPGYGMGAPGYGMGGGMMAPGYGMGGGMMGPGMGMNPGMGMAPGMGVQMGGAPGMGARGFVGRTLLIRPTTAMLSHDTETFGKMDPQVEVVVGQSKYRTNICKNGGKTPQWNDVISHNIRGDETQMIIVIWDIDSASKNDMIGEVRVDLNETFLRGNTSQYYDLNFHGKPAGRVMVSLQVL